MIVEECDVCVIDMVDIEKRRRAEKTERDINSYELFLSPYVVYETHILSYRMISVLNSQSFVRETLRFEKKKRFRKNVNPVVP